MNKMQGFLQNVRSLFAASLHFLNANFIPVRSGGKSAAEEGFFALSRLWFSSVIFCDLQHKNDEDRHDQRIDDDRFDEHKSHHH